MRNKNAIIAKEIFSGIFADGIKKLPFKYKGADVYEPTFKTKKSVCIGRFPFALIKNGMVLEPTDEELEEVLELSLKRKWRHSRKRHRIFHYVHS